jgi:hypothetical protein
MLDFGFLVYLALVDVCEEEIAIGFDCVLRVLPVVVLEADPVMRLFILGLFLIYEIWLFK